MIFGQAVTEVYETFSHQPSYYNGHVYYHFDEYLFQMTKDGSSRKTMYQGSEIGVDDTYGNINSTTAISKDNNIIFVVGTYLCAFEISGFDKLWCNEMNGGSTQGVTPAVDDNSNNVFIFDDGYIYSYNQSNGDLTYRYGNGMVTNECNSNYSCLSLQPIVTPYNILCMGRWKKCYCF